MQPINGATRSSYTVKSIDAGKQISVAVTGTLNTGEGPYAPKTIYRSKNVMPA